MSNRRRLKPPAAVTTAARAYRCGHCQSVTGRLHIDRDGIWHLKVHHDETCPVLAGTVSPVPSGLRSMATAAQATGQRVLYLGTDPG